MPSPQPIIVLVHTQLGENIGMCARAMLNCGLHHLRLVAPRDGWPNPRAVATAADADCVIAGIECFATVAEAIADCTRVFATTARRRELALPALEVGAAIGEIRGMETRCAILFGPEASGLDNESLSHADCLLDFPVNPEFSSLNLAQAVLLFAWEWWGCTGMGSGEMGRTGGMGTVARVTEPPATKAALGKFFARFEKELEKGDFFLSADLRPDTVRNLRAFFGRATPSERELQMLHGVVTALVSRRRSVEAGTSLCSSVSGATKDADKTAIQTKVE